MEDAAEKLSKHLEGIEVENRAPKRTVWALIVSTMAVAIFAFFGWVTAISADQPAQYPAPFAHCEDVSLNP